MPNSTENKTPPLKLFDKESFRLVAVLASVAFVAALLLSVVYMFTEATIDYEARLIETFNENYTSESYVEVELTADLVRDYTSISSAYLADDGAMLITAFSEKAYSSDGIEIIVIIKDDIIVAVIKNAASETPGLGSNALTDDYLEQYVGFNVNDFVFVGTEGDNTDESTNKATYVTGATKSSTGVQYAVESAVLFYLQMGV